MKSILTLLLLVGTFVSSAQVGSLQIQVLEACVPINLASCKIVSNGQTIGRANSRGEFSFQSKIDGPVKIVHPFCETFELKKVKYGSRAENLCTLTFKPGVVDSLTKLVLPQVDFSGVSDSVDVPAEFVGGMQEFTKFLKNNLRFPQSAVENGVSGRVYVSLLIDERGNVKGAQIDRSVELCCDLEALRVAKSFPPFTPAMKDGVAVASRWRFPIKFELKY